MFSDMNMGILATRVYMIILTVSITILALQSSIATHTRTVHVLEPSRATFEALHAAHSDTLSCPCSHISIPIGQLISISAPKFHQVRLRA